MVSGNGTLKGKVALITGGGTGLGRAMALALAREGANVAVAARRVEPLERTAKDVRALGRKALVVPTDVTDSQQVNKMVEKTLADLGQIDILINNAGIVRGERRKPIWEVTDEEWRHGIDVNLSGAFFSCRAVGKYLVERKRGKVINVASGYGMRGGKDNYMYCCAKGGVIQLTRSLALTWAQDNIQVNSIVPGFVDTREGEPRAGRSGGGPGGEFIMVGRLGIPADIGSLGLFLASNASDYVTGGVFAADGGGLAGGLAPTGFAPTMLLKEEE